MKFALSTIVCTPVRYPLKGKARKQLHVYDDWQAEGHAIGLRDLWLRLPIVLVLLVR